MINIENCSINSFKKQINEGKKIICFCAGQALIDLCQKYKFEDNLLYVVDNYKKNEIMTIKNYQIRIISIYDVREEIQDAIPIITSIKYVKEIITQLDTIPIFNGIKFYVPYIFTDEKPELPLEEIKLKENNRIPKIIHYCWFGKNEMPKKFKDNILSWEKNCPDYEIKRWDESNYDISKNKYMMQAYERKKWGFVPDYARLDIINTHGGIYLDTDVEVLKSYDDLLSYDFFCGFENTQYIALGLGFGGVANNNLLGEMMMRYDEIEFINEDGGLNLTASPVYQSEIMEKNGFIRNGKTQVKDNMIVLAPEYLAPINPMGVGTPTINSYSIHQYAATWFDDKQMKEKEEIMDSIKFVMKRMEKGK